MLRKWPLVQATAVLRSEYSLNRLKKKKASCREASSYMHKIYMNVT